MNTQTLVRRVPAGKRGETPSAAEIAWTAYCRAAERAQRTLRVADALEAGHCWARFLALFVTRETVA